MIKQKKEEIILNRKVKCLFLQILLISLLILNPSPLSAGKLSPDELAKNIDKFLKKVYLENEPGASVLAARDGKVVLSKGYGIADFELGVQVRPEMVFRLGSITKQFTATAIMMLAEQGKLSVKDEITKFLPDYPTHGHRIIIEHLLSHTSGIKNITSMPEIWPIIRRDFSVKELIDLFKKEPMDFAPGQRFLYSNSGYLLLGAIIEKISGKTYQDFIKKKIFDPLGMKNSYYGSHNRIIPNRVSGYKIIKFIRSSSFENADFLSMTQPYSAGSLLSSVDDLFLWNNALANGNVIPKKSYEQMLTPAKLNNGKNENYGYGFSISQFLGHRMIAHGGGIHGFRTFALRIPDKKAFVAVLTNCEGKEPRPDYVARWIAALLIGKPIKEKDTIKLNPKILDSYVGIYQISENDFLTVTLEGNQLFTQRTRRPKLPAFAESETIFFYKNSLSYFTFVKDKNGKVIKMIIHNTAGDEEALKTDKVPKARQEIKLDPTIYDNYGGTYEKSGFQIKIFREDNRFMARAIGQEAVEIFPENELKFFLKDVDAQIEFQKDDRGNVIGLILYQSRQKFELKKR